MGRYKHFEIDSEGNLEFFDDRVHLYFDGYKMDVCVNLKNINLLVCRIDNYQEKLKDPDRYGFRGLDDDLDSVFEHAREIDIAFKVLDEHTMYTEQVEDQYIWI